MIFFTTKFPTWFQGLELDVWNLGFRVQNNPHSHPRPYLQYKFLKAYKQFKFLWRGKYLHREDDHLEIIK